MFQKSYVTPHLTCVISLRFRLTTSLHIPSARREAHWQVNKKSTIGIRIPQRLTLPLTSGCELSCFSHFCALRALHENQRNVNQPSTSSREHDQNNKFEFSVPWYFFGSTRILNLIMSVLSYSWALSRCQGRYCTTYFTQVQCCEPGTSMKNAQNSITFSFLYNRKCVNV